MPPPSLVTTSILNTRQKLNLHWVRHHTVSNPLCPSAPHPQCTKSPTNKCNTMWSPAPPPPLHAPSHPLPPALSLLSRTPKTEPRTPSSWNPHRHSSPQAEPSHPLHSSTPATATLAPRPRGCPLRARTSTTTSTSRGWTTLRTPSPPSTYFDARAHAACARRARRTRSPPLPPPHTHTLPGDHTLVS